MPSDDLARRVRRQSAVYWRKTGTDSFGKPQFAAPADVKVRWTDQAQELTDQKGDKIVSRSIVFVGQDMTTGDVIKLGTVATLTPGKAPLQQPGAYEIRMFRKIPNRTARKYLRKAIL